MFLLRISLFIMHCEINERTKKASQFYHLVKELLRNKYINERFKLYVLKIYFKRILTYGAETRTTKREDSKIQKKGMIRNNIIRSELGMDETKNYIENCRLRWFGHVMQMIKERIQENTTNKN